MDAFAKALLFMLPSFFLMIIIEAIYAKYKGKFNFRTMDVVSSLSAGMTNALKSVLGLTVIIVGYKYLFQHFALIEREINWFTYLSAFVALDFATYCYHRLAHSVNIFWNRHVIHHSGEDFNTATALRQSISKFVNVSVFFLIPAAMMGLPPKIIAIVTPLHLFVQVWYHTEHIGKLGWLEYIIVTPSQHRVHHAINPIYLDKNLSPVFCVWDRAFGTFQEELEEEPCVYGVTRQVNTWNPILINLDHLWLLIKDAWRAESWWDTCRIWFMPTGWRPADVEKKYPIVSAKPSEFTKYNTPASTNLKIWTWTQFLVLVSMVFHVLYQLVEIGSPAMFVYGGFLYLMVYSYTTLMDRNSNALWLEALKSAIGLGIIYSTGTWFSLDTILPFGTVLVAAYQIVSVLVVAWFVVKEIGEEQELEKLTINAQS
ncbi:MAG: sterol desaturase family protein [Chitinophagales bacterium]